MEQVRQYSPISYNEQLFTGIFDDLLPNMKHIFVIPQLQLPSFIKDLDTCLNKADPVLLAIGVCLTHLVLFVLMGAIQINKKAHPEVIAYNHETRSLPELEAERKQYITRPRARRSLRSEIQEKCYRAAQRSTLGPQSGEKRKRCGDGKGGLKKARLG